MNREYVSWHSAALDRDMELLIFGHAGARVLAFPPSQGRFYDWEDRGMVNALGHSIDKGLLQLFCVDSVDAESWYNRAVPPAVRAARHVQYDTYLLEEVLPFSAERNPEPFVITAGPSFGAYHAVNFAFRHPTAVGRALGLSGVYDVSEWANGFANDDTYFNNPAAYISNEHDPERLAALQSLDIILAIGEDDRNRPDNENFSTILWEKDIWHALRIWDGWAHDWPYWRKMLRLYIGGHD